MMMWWFCGLYIVSDSQSEHRANTEDACVWFNDNVTQAEPSIGGCRPSMHRWCDCTFNRQWIYYVCIFCMSIRIDSLETIWIGLMVRDIVSAPVILLSASSIGKTSFYSYPCDFFYDFCWTNWGQEGMGCTCLCKLCALRVVLHLNVAHFM